MSRYFQAFVLWQLSLAVCCASSESQSSSGRISASVSEQRDRGPFATDVLASLTLFLLVLLNPVASRDVHPTPSVPDLTSRAGASLFFVFLKPAAASCPWALQSSGPQSGDARSGSWSQSALSRVLVCVSARAPLFRCLPLPSTRTQRLPPASIYLPISVCGFMAPCFVPQYSALEMFFCRDPDVSSCVSG